MDDDDDINAISRDVEKFTRLVNNISLDDDTYQVKSQIEELEQMYERINTNMDEFDADLDSNKKPLLNKLSEFKSDLEIAKNKLNEKKNVWQNQHNLELLKEGQLTGYQKVKAERDIIMDQHKETDYQGEVIKSIGENIIDANKNLVGINQELNQQGDKMVNIQKTTNDMEGTVHRTGGVMSKIEWRNKCAKVVGIIAIIVVGLADIAILIFKLVKR
jgi:chromosome segregation ATPase